MSRAVNSRAKGAGAERELAQDLCLRNRPPAQDGTGKTGKSPPSHERRGGGPTGKTGESPLVPVLPVPPGAIPEKRDAWPDLYRAWFEGIEEPCALVTLSPDQTREAVTAGAVPEDLAGACILVVYRSPLGACGLLAVPRGKWDAFDALRVLEGAPCLH